MFIASGWPCCLAFMIACDCIVVACDAVHRWPTESSPVITAHQGLPSPAGHVVPTHHTGQPLTALRLAAAPQVFGTPQFSKMVKACIAQDLSWSKPATKWEAILTEVTTGDFVAQADKKASIVTPVQERATASV